MAVCRLEQRKRQLDKLLKPALEEGINYFDTADLYDFGENEKIVGTALKEVREKVIIATKVGNRWNKDQRAGHGTRRSPI